MAERHFEITADATQAQAAAKEVAGSLANMAKAAHAVEVELKGLKTVPATLRTVSAAVISTTHKIDRMAAQAKLAAMSMNRSFASVRGPNVGGGMGGGLHSVNGIPRSHLYGGYGIGYNPSNGASGSFGSNGSINWNGIKNQAGGASRRGGIRPHFPSGGGGSSRRGRKGLFGMSTEGLEQGQDFQNLLMGASPLAIPALMFGYGKYLNIQKNVADIQLKNQVARNGRGGNGSDFISASKAITQFAGGNPLEVQARVGQLALAGARDSKTVKGFGNLAADITAGGGDGDEFIKALSLKGPEMAKAMHEVAKGLGVLVPATASVNEVIAALKTNVGGLSHEMEEAREGWPSLWRTIKENLAMLGNEGITGQAVSAATAYLKGETYDPIGSGRDKNAPSKAGFIGNGMAWHAGQLDTMSKLGATGQSIVSGNDMQPVADFKHVKNAVVSRIAFDLQKNKINADQAKARMDAYREARDKNDKGAIWDMAYQPQEDLNKIPVAVSGPSGQATPATKNKISSPNEDPRKVTIAIKNDSSSPSQFKSMMK